MSAKNWSNSMKLLLQGAGQMGGSVEKLLVRLNPEGAIELGEQGRLDLLRDATKELITQEKVLEKLQSELKTNASTLLLKQGGAKLAMADTENPAAEQAKQAFIRAIRQLKETKEELEVKIAGTQTLIDLLQDVVERRQASVDNFNAEVSMLNHRNKLAAIQKDQAVLIQQAHGMATEDSLVDLSVLSGLADEAEIDALTEQRLAGNAAGNDDGMTVYEAAAQNGAKKTTDEELAALLD